MVGINCLHLITLLVIMTAASGSTTTLHILNLLKNTLAHMMPQVSSHDVTILLLTCCHGIRQLRRYVRGY